ncbi:MAG: hypothetical protein HY432_02605 [Candidatus Liptonbacteria bacterium]|nr:hypothetical protein [Candidatus Liptonbacteria bacterium]
MLIPTKSFFVRSKREKKRFFSEGGQSIIEALVAISFLVVGFMAVLSLLGRSLSLNRSSTDSYTATYLATEGIEVAKNIFDENALRRDAWNDGFAAGDYEVEYDSNSLRENRNRFLAYDSNRHVYRYGGSGQTPFMRIIRVTPVGQNEIKINSIVSWTGLGGGSFQVNLEDHFMNWRN